MLSPIDDVLNDLRAGRMVILTDDEDRENEGDLVLPAQFVTPEAITFMLSVARGYLCLSLTEADCQRLELSPQSAVNSSVRGTAFTVSIDGHPRHGFTTGVSAKERSRAIQMAIDPAYGPADFVRPGHINPLRSRDGGVLVRIGQTEGSVDLCRLAGLYPAAIIIEVMRDDGEMARLPDLMQIAKKHELKICSVAQIIEHRLQREALVRRLAPTQGRPLRTPVGTFTLLAFESMVDPLPHLALTTGGIGSLDPNGRVVESREPVLVRMHRRHLLGDVFHDLDSSAKGATGDRLERSMKLISGAGKGAIVYLRPEGVGSGIDQGLTTIKRTGFATGAGGGDAPDLTGPTGVGAKAVPASMRDFGVGGQILRNLGISRLRLITDSSADLPGLDAFGIEIVERVGV